MYVVVQFHPGVYIGRSIEEDGSVQIIARMLLDDETDMINSATKFVDAANAELGSNENHAVIEMRNAIEEDTDFIPEGE